MGVQLARAGGGVHLGEIGRTLGEAGGKSGGTLVVMGEDGGTTGGKLVVQAWLVVVIGRKWEKIGRKVGVQIDLFSIVMIRRVGGTRCVRILGLRSRTRRSLPC